MLFSLRACFSEKSAVAMQVSQLWILEKTEKLRVD